MKLSQLNILIKSGIPIICINTQIQERITAISEIYNFAKLKQMDLELWNLGWGSFKKVEFDFTLSKLKFSPIPNDFNSQNSGIFAAFDYLLNCQEHRFLIIENLFSILKDKSSDFFPTKIISQITNVYYELEQNNHLSHHSTKILILLTTDSTEVPNSLNSLIPTIFPPLPNQEEIHIIIQDFLKVDPQKFDLSPIINVASGLTPQEIRSGYLYACTSLNLDPTDFSSHYIKSIAHRLLNYKTTRFRDLNLNFISQTNSEFGGFDLLKKFIKTVQLDFSQKARSVNIPLPKGCLLVGPPGTGKTLSARVSAKILGFPLISVDTAAVAEAGAPYLKRLIQRVEASAPAVLYFDEFDVRPVCSKLAIA